MSLFFENFHIFFQGLAKTLNLILIIIMIVTKL